MSSPQQKEEKPTSSGGKVVMKEESKQELKVAETKLQAAKGELQAAKGELQAAETKLQAAETKLQAAETKLQAAKGELHDAFTTWDNHPTEDAKKTMLKGRYDNCNKQVESCNKQVESWGDRVSAVLKQISELEATPAGSTGTPSVVADLTQLLKEASISRPQPQSLNAMLRDNYPLLQEYVKLKDVTAVVEMYTSYKEMVRLSTKAVCAQKKLNIGARLGTMFSVYSGSQNGSPVIIKKVSAASMEFQMAALFRDHDSIVQIDNSIVYNDSAMLVMSKYPCSLFDAVVTDGDLLFTGVISMVEALNHVHSKGVVHMDVKPHNIFVTQSGVWLLGDFGSATFEGEKISTTTSKLLLEPVTSGSTSAAYKFDWQMLVVGILHMVQASQVQDGVSITPLLCEEEKYHASKVKCLELLRAFPHSRLQQLLCQLLSCQMQTFDRDFAEEEEDKDSSSSSSSSSSPQ